MNENERIKNLISYLIINKYVRNQQEFVERVESNKSTISQIVNNKISVTNNLVSKIVKLFPFISLDWLLTGDGDMLKDATHINGDKNIVGNNKSVGDVRMGDHSSFNQNDMEHLVEMVKYKDHIIAKLRKQIEEQHSSLVVRLDEKDRIIKEKDLIKVEMLKQIDEYRKQVENNHIKIQNLYDKIIELTNNSNK